MAYRPAGTFILAVDGPARGELLSLPAGTPFVQYSDWAATDGTSSAVVYHVHKWAMLGRTIRLGSVHADGNDIDQDALWDALVATLARYAAEDVWCPYGPACPSGLGGKHRVAQACLGTREEVHQ